MSSYMKKILRINLSNNKIKDEIPDDKLLRAYIGGCGLASKLIIDEIQGNTNPLGKENKLLFMTGPLVGTTAPSNGRYVVCSKSPLTNIWGEAHSGGRFGPELKFAGIDGLIFEGKANNPVYLKIEDESIEIKDAYHIWGQDTYKTEKALKSELGDKKFKVACIGQAGENMLKISSVMNDMGRAAGRCGLGAVMGSKKLKAIAVKGSKKPEIADEKFNELALEFRKNISERGGILRKYGTPLAIRNLSKYGDIPIKNWQLGDWEGLEKINEIANLSILRKPIACYGCPVGCGRDIEIKEGVYKVEGAGPEYETLAAFGSSCLNANLESIVKCNDICNRYGLDTISAGSTVAFAIECFEKGLISKEELGFELTWGNHEAIVKLTELMANNEGFGKILNDGTKIASKKIKGSENFAVHVKGMEIPMHDPRAFYSMGLEYATANRGASHLEGTPFKVALGSLMPELGINEIVDRFETSGKGRITALTQNVNAVSNSTIMCVFVRDYISASDFTKLLNYATGFDYTVSELLKIGDRIYNVKRVFNILCGITEKDDNLPPRSLEPTKEGGNAGKVPDMKSMLKEYYEFRGWKNGVPTKERLKELDLEYLIPKVYI
ncbi:MAG: aldehyde ferredoxin oxidoreductase family protein [Candidatus Helarchaeota archaeon]|nr:aldehyde ferredoxin oxidoreductase family protein [Candidatus Helarchaeota archaeon]